MKIVSFISIGIAILLLAGCASQGYKSDIEAFKGYTAKQIYTGGSTALAKKDYATAVKHFEALDALYPFGQYSDRAQLKILYAYYQNSDFDSVVAAAERYIKLHPQGLKTDYAYYMRGLANFERNRTWFNKIYATDPAARDLTSIEQSYADFNAITKLYPQSLYVKDAKRRMLYIRQSLARHEIQVANFYMQRKAYVAAANRASNVVQHFKDTPYTKEGLQIMYEAYHHLGATKPAEEAMRALKTS